MLLFGFFKSIDIYILCSLGIYLTGDKRNRCTTFLYGFNMLNKLETSPHENQNVYEDLDFFNFACKSIVKRDFFVK